MGIRLIWANCLLIFFVGCSAVPTAEECTLACRNVVDVTAKAIPGAEGAALGVARRLADDRWFTVSANQANGR